MKKKPPGLGGGVYFWGVINALSKCVAMCDWVSIWIRKLVLRLSQANLEGKSSPYLTHP